MADGTITVTIDTGEWVYPDASGVSHTVTNGQTFTLASRDDGTGATYRPNVGQSVTTTDGYRVVFHGYNNQTNVVTPAGDTAVTNSNSALGDWVLSCTSDGVQELWKCTGLDMDDADAATSFTSARFEKVSDPTQIFTWTSVDAAFA